MKLNVRLLLINVLVFFAQATTQAQNWIPAPGKLLEGKTYIMNATLHLGNGEVIPNGVLGMENGRIILVADATVVRLNMSDAKTIDAYGKHVYPALISPNSILGLSETGAVRAQRDYYEVGDYNSNVRALIAYNTDSQITPTVRSNGVLMAQIVPQGGRISGTSSVVQLDAWNWEDAAVKADEGMWLSFPSLYEYEEGRIVPSKKYEQQLQELEQFFTEAANYCQAPSDYPQNLKFEAMCGVFEGSKKLYIRANLTKEIMAAVQFAKRHQVKMVLAEGAESWLVADILKENDIPVIIQKTHQLPRRNDDDIDIFYKLPALLQNAGVLYAVSAENDSGEQRNLAFTAGKAVAYGLTKEQALSAITSNTAAILGIDAAYGTLEQGKQASFIISKGDVLDPMTQHIERAFVDGREVNLENKQKDLYHKYMSKYNLPEKQN